MGKMEMKPEQSFEQRVERRFRLIEANVGLLLNYVRYIAKSYLTPAKAKELEDEYEHEREAIDDES
jgi:hypothetical protein